jgi:uncharacterized protein (DUF983 family)
MTKVRETGVASAKSRSAAWLAVIVTVPAFRIVIVEPFRPVHVAIVGSELVNVTGKVPLPPVAETEKAASP